MTTQRNSSPLTSTNFLRALSSCVKTKRETRIYVTEKREILFSDNVHFKSNTLHSITYVSSYSFITCSFIFIYLFITLRYIF